MSNLLKHHTPHALAYTNDYTAWHVWNEMFYYDVDLLLLLLNE